MTSRGDADAPNSSRSESLRAYRDKRDFSRTPEPRGAREGGAPRATGRLFVVQKHAARQLHYDLRLEFDGVLRSWAVPKGPSLDPGQKPLAVEVEEHPLEYGDFEGIIPEGEYGGGTVMLWDRGDWEPIGDAVDGYARGDLKFRLHGEKLRGAWVLARMTGKAAEDGRNWLLIKKRDETSRPVSEYNVLAEAPRSVLSGRTMDEITRAPGAVWKDGARHALTTGDHDETAAFSTPERPSGDDLPGATAAALPAALAPQLAESVRRAPEGDDWLHEIKLDGYRLLCRIEDGAARFFTRGGHDWTDRFEPIVRAAQRLPLASAWLDGEVVILDARGISDFSALQNAFKGYGARPFVYFVFDVPYADGCDLRRVPLVDRKRFLAAVVGAAPLAHPTLQYCSHIVGRGPTVHAEAARSGLEGIISKRSSARYASRRTSDWVKVKCQLREEFVVAGYTPPRGSRTGLGALVLAQHGTDGALVYRGRVGTGFDRRTLTELTARLESRRCSEAPVVNPAADPDRRSIRWVEPELVAAIEFTAWTADRLVRHAVFKGLREDKPARQVVARDEVDESIAVGAPRANAVVEGVTISHPERTVYPDDGVTKGEVAAYFAAIAPHMLAHVAGRPLSIVRCPLGLAGDAFYQRELGEGFPRAIRGLQVGEDHAILVRDAAGLVGLAQMGTLEIHAWGSRADKPDRPDRLVLDLDPGPGITWPDVVAAAGFVRDRVRDIGLECYVKTTGGRGVHIVVPIVRRLTWADAKAFTKAIADELVRLAPLNFVSTMAKDRREQRIFIDYLRNQLGSTAVAAYSTRARAGAGVSTPLAWDELSSGAPPSTFTVRTVVELAEARDPWPGFDAQSVTRAMRTALEA